MIRKGICFSFLIALFPILMQAQPAQDSLAVSMARFFDSLVPQQMQETHVPGLVVSVVRGDRILFEKGYGAADIQRRQAVDPQQTIWRLASISKVVTATAVMQLVEQGKLDLDRDVNAYLKTFQIPEKFGKPITLRELLTHTAGFDDRYIGKSFRTQAERPPLREFVKKLLPARIFPPGEVYVYSNLGLALAALVVENVSGQDFNDYCRQHIFLPLGMKETSFRLDPALKNHLYQGYIFQNGNFKAVPFDFLGDYPAGQLLSTASEFSRFMICQLNDGMLDGVRILSPKTVTRMQSTQFTENPRLNGSIGFVVDIFQVDGNKVVAHDGGYLGTATRMWLLPGQKTGLFMATNIMNMGAIQKVSYAFVKRFFDQTQPPKVKYPLDSLPAYDPHVAKFTGFYRLARYAHSDITKMGVLTSHGIELPIWKNNQGMLMMYNLYGKPRRMIQVQPGVFQSIDDDYSIAFHLDRNGNPTFLFTSGTGAFEKVPAFYTIRIQRLLLGALLAFFVLILLLRKGTRFLPSGRWKERNLSVQHRKIRKTSSWTASLFLLQWLGLGLALFVVRPAYETFTIGLAYGVGPVLYVVQVIPFVAILFLIFTGIHFVKILKEKNSSWKIGVFYGLFILSALLYLVLLNYWNLLGFRF